MNSWPENCLQTRPKIVAMVGLGTSFHDFAVAQMQGRRDIPEFDEVWTLNGGIGWCKADKCFDMHDLHDVERTSPRLGRYMRDSTVPILTLKKYKEFPASVTYPLKEMLNAVQFDFFSCTPAYMMGYAMLLGSIEHIWFFGMDFLYPKIEMREEGSQSMAFLMGMAFQRGISPHIPSTSTLLGANKACDIEGTFRRPLYGYHKGSWASAEAEYKYGADNPINTKADGAADEQVGAIEGAGVPEGQGRERADGPEVGQGKPLS